MATMGREILETASPERVVKKPAYRAQESIMTLADSRAVIDQPDQFPALGHPGRHHRCRDPAYR
jgi:hypothetical protein